MAAARAHAAVRVAPARRRRWTRSTEAARLAPRSAEARVGARAGARGERPLAGGAAAFAEALRLDPEVLDGRPAAQAAFDAGRAAGRRGPERERPRVDPQPGDRVARRLARRGVRPPLVARHQPARQPARADAARPPGARGRAVTTPGRSRLHAAYWKYAVWRRITARSAAVRARRAATGSRCRRPRRRPRAQTSRCCSGTTGCCAPRSPRLPDEDLERRAPGGREPIGRLVRGIAAHDLYHAGQIQLIKRFS